MFFEANEFNPAGKRERDYCPHHYLVSLTIDGSLAWNPKWWQRKLFKVQCDTFYFEKKRRLALSHLAAVAATSHWWQLAIRIYSREVLCYPTKHLPNLKQKKAVNQLHTTFLYPGIWGLWNVRSGIGGERATRLLSFVAPLTPRKGCVVRVASRLALIDRLWCHHYVNVCEAGGGVDSTSRVSFT